MVINVEVGKTGSENNVNLVRKFNKRVQASGILPRARSIRHNQRPLSEYTKKKKALKKIARKKETAKLIKLGKMAETQSGS